MFCVKAAARWKPLARDAVAGCLYFVVMTPIGPYLVVPRAKDYCASQGGITRARTRSLSAGLNLIANLVVNGTSADATIYPVSASGDGR